LEGFDPVVSCPYVHQSSIEEDDAQAAVMQDELVALPAAEALSEFDAAKITRNQPTKLVIIAGPYNSGKTTILTALFEAFQEAPFANFIFRGSKTLVGFEKRCHLGRIESGNHEPDTLHTSVREGIRFLHLSLLASEKGASECTDLLLSDISGESFRRIRDSSAAAKEMEVLNRADHLCIVIDGDKLTSLETRQSARSDSRSLIRSIIEAGVIAPECIIDVVISKFDLIVEKQDNDVEEFIDQMKKALAEVASNHTVEFHDIAARPHRNAKVPFAHGLPTLLRSWMRQKTQAGIPTFLLSQKPQREFGRFSSSVLKRYSLKGQSYDVRQL
jgi:hypothetical protein